MYALYMSTAKAPAAPSDRICEKNFAIGTTYVPILAHRM